MVRDRYYIKTEGDNAPMNISPAFKLGMNVKEMSYFSTTTDSIIFPDVMMKVVGEESISQGKAMKLDIALQEAGMVLESGDKVILVDINGIEYPISLTQLESSYLIPSGNSADAIIGGTIIKEVQRITKIQE
jgi:hypothetical protein